MKPFVNVNFSMFLLFIFNVNSYFSVFFNLLFYYIKSEREENVPHCLRHLNTWSIFGGTVWGNLGGQPCWKKCVTGGKL